MHKDLSKSTALYFSHLYAYVLASRYSRAPSAVSDVSAEATPVPRAGPSAEQVLARYRPATRP